MCRLLIALAALLGFGGSAYAGQLIEVNPTTTPPTIGDATGVPIKPPKTASSSPAFNPDPGKIIIRLDGLLVFDTGFIGGAGMMQGNVLGGTPAHPVLLGSGKLDSFTNNGYFRLYFGADGQLGPGSPGGPSAISAPRSLAMSASARVTGRSRRGPELA
jgi:hypothetical protein